MRIRLVAIWAALAVSIIATSAMGQVCGDSILETGEDCDDGNIVDGDCCSSSCSFEVGSCDDGDACSVGDTCDGAGACVPGSAPDCDDGNLCTKDSCDSSIGCVNASAARRLCRTASQSVLVARDKSPDQKDALIWRWTRGEATTPGDFADPTTTANYGICVYQGSGGSEFLQIEIPPDTATWRTSGDGGYRYKDPQGTADGVDRVVLKPGAEDKSKILVRMRGENLPDLSSIAFPSTTSTFPLVFQLVNEETGECWQSEFESDDARADTGEVFRASAKAGDTIIVQSGESIQAAVDAAAPGSRIIVKPGTYVETHGGQAAVLVEKSLQLIGDNESGEVIILPGPGNTEGIYVRGTAENFIEDILIENFTIDGFSRNGIWTFYVRDFEIRNNKVGNADHVGIYPQLSAQGLVRNNVAFGGLDSAMWVSGSEDIRVIDNEVYAAPIGLQVNVSKDVEVETLTARDNTAGVLFSHPLSSGLGDDVDLAFGYRSEFARFADSEVIENNMPNPVSGGSVGSLPSGSGLLIIGHDRLYADNNSILSNNFAGMVLVDHCLVTGDTDEDCAPDGNSITGNTITGNGTNPEGPFAPLANDVIVLGVGDDNCMADNTYDTNLGAAAIEAASCPAYPGD
jgi:cysteine-rich repeat protein